MGVSGRGPGGLAGRNPEAVTATLAPPATGARGGPADLMPPLALPGVHFAAALVWLVAGAAGLVLVAPDLARGGFLLPRVVAVTHAFTLGWITTSIFGALYQLYPVTLGVAARSVPWGFGGFLLLQPGIVLLVAGAWWWKPEPLAAGWLLLAAAVGVVSWNLLPQRRRAQRGRTIGAYVSLGHAALGVAMGIVLIRIGAELGWWRTDRLGLVSAHAHFAVVGFATLTAVGVGSKLLPMFLLSRGAAERPLRWIGPLVAAGLLVHAAGSIWHLQPVLLAGAVLIAAALIEWLGVVRSYYRTSIRQGLEPALAHVATAFGFLAAATIVGLALAFVEGTDARRIAAYGVLGILGWLSLLIIGMYYKILPFLTWLHRFSPRVGERGVPKVADLTSPALQWTTLVLLVIGIGGLAVSVTFGAPTGAARSAAVIALGVFLVSAQHGRLAFRRSS